MSTITSSSEDLTLNADGTGNDIKFQSNGVEKASLSDAGVLTAISFSGDGSSLSGLSSSPGPKTAIFTSSGNYTVPAGVTNLSVSGAGGGGGGGAGQYWSGSRTGGKGGAGAPVEKRTVPVTAGATYTVTIGAGGAGGNSTGANSGNAGGAGNSSSIGSVLTLGAGGGGSAGAPGCACTGNTGAVGTITGGSGGITAVNGGYSVPVTTTDYGLGGNGGSSNTGGNTGSGGILIIEVGE